MNINIIQVLQLLKNGGNPQQIVMNLIQQENNPMLNNLISMGQQGDVKGLEMVARNIAKEKGIDFDKEFSNFRNMIGQ